MKAKFPKAFEAATRHRAQIERSGAVAPHAVRAQRKFPVILDIDAAGAHVRGKSRGDEACGKLFNWRNMDALLAEICTLAAHRRKKLIAHWIVNNTDQRLAILHQTNRNGEARITVREIRGAVERVHMPAILRTGGRAAASLLRDDG